MSPKPYLFNLSGPYAVGKDSILNKLASTFGKRLYRVQTITTRPVSKTVDPTYTHVNPTEFERRVSDGRWIANYQLSGLTAYGTSIDEIEEAAKAGLICIHSVYAGPQGAGKLREFFGENAISVGLQAGEGSALEQLEILRHRLVGRSRDESSAIEARLKHQLEPLEYVINNPTVVTPDGRMKVFDHIIVNNDLEETAQLAVRLFGNIFFGGEL